MRSPEVDIVVSGNFIGGRQGYAYIFNSGKIKSVKCDLDKKQEYDSFHTYDKIKVAIETKSHGVMDHVGTVEWNNGKWEIGQSGCCISSHFGFHDAMEMADNANLPIVMKGQIVALFQYSDSKRTCKIELCKVDHVNEFCTTLAGLRPLTDDEMQEVVQDVNNWVTRIWYRR